MGKFSNYPAFSCSYFALVIDFDANLVPTIVAMTAKQLSAKLAIEGVKAFTLTQRSATSWTCRARDTPAASHATPGSPKLSPKSLHESTRVEQRSNSLENQG